MQRSAFLNELQSLRGLAVMLVVLAHIHQADARFLAPGLFGDIVYFGFAGVDLFFVISGFIIHHLYRDHDRPDAAYFLKRINRIYPLYWIFTLAALAGYFVIGDALTASAGELDYLASATLSPSAQLPILQVGWTLTHELYFYLAYGLALALPRRGRLIAAALWAVASLAFMAVEPGSLGPWVQVLLSPFNLLFLAGVVLAELFNRLNATRHIALGLAIASTLMALVWMSLTGIDGLGVPRWRVLLIGPFAVTTVWAVLAWRPALPRFSVSLGDWSYSIYLSHILVIGVLARFAPEVTGTSWLASLALYVVCLIACTIFGALSYRLLEKPLLKLGRRMMPSG